MKLETKLANFSTFISPKYSLVNNYGKESDSANKYGIEPTKEKNSFRNTSITNINQKKVKKNKNKLKTLNINIKSTYLIKDNLQISSNKKLMFLVHKRKHSIDRNDIEQISERKKPLYKKHDKYEKDNIVTKIQIHYKNFLKSLVNSVIKKIILDESYKSRNLDKIIHLNEYLFNNIDHKFKSNIKKEIMKFT